jgi:hypothetical protein
MRRALVLLALVLGGCGDSLVAGDFRPPYFSLTVQYEFQTSIALPTAGVPLAIIWNGAQPNGVAVQAGNIPSSSNTGEFTFNIENLPPPSVFLGVPAELVAQGVDPDMSYAVGTLVAYIDRNGNGRLDIGSEVVRDGSHDEVLGAATDFALFYLAHGRPASQTDLSIFPTEPGFSIVHLPTLYDPPPGKCDRFDGQGRHFYYQCQQFFSIGPALVDPTTPIHLVLDDDPDAQRFACSPFLGPADYEEDHFANPGDICDSPTCKYCQGYTCPIDLPPAGVKVTCSSDGLEYAFKTCSEIASECDTRICHYGHWAIEPGDPVPAGWPCAIP